MRKILVRVVEGKCQGGYHKVGDIFEIDHEDPLTPQGMCFGAFGSVFPYIMVLSCNGVFPWEDGKTKTRIHCADPEGITLEVEKSVTEQ